MLDAPGTDVTVAASDPAEQAKVLDALCTKGVLSIGGTCDFIPQKIDYEATRTVSRVGKKSFINCDLKDGLDVREIFVDEVGSEDSVGGSISASVEGEFIIGKVKTEVKTTYGHKWIDKHQFKSELGFKVEKGMVAWVEDIAPVVRVTGDFKLTLGNTTLTLAGVYFDHPDPSREGSFKGRGKKATADECAPLGGAGPRPSSAVTITQRGSAGANTLSGGRGSDVLRGLGGNDVLVAGGGNNKLFGGPGNDLLVGGSGHDVLDGGPGADTIIDTRGPALVRTSKRPGRGWDYVYVRDGHADDTVICGSRHTIVVADKGDKVRGHCGKVIRRGPIDQPKPLIP
jgi:hypothetical protein